MQAVFVFPPVSLTLAFMLPTPAVVVVFALEVRATAPVFPDNAAGNQKGGPGHKRHGRQESETGNHMGHGKAPVLLEVRGEPDGAASLVEPKTRSRVKRDKPGSTGVYGLVEVVVLCMMVVSPLGETDFSSR